MAFRKKKEVEEPKAAKVEEVVEAEPKPLVCEKCGSVSEETGCVCCNRH